MGNYYFHEDSPIRPVYQKQVGFLPSLLTSLPTYLLTPWSKVLLEKLTGSQLKKFPAFYGTPGSLPHLQVTTICSYPEPDQSSPYQTTSLPEYQC